MTKTAWEGNDSFHLTHPTKQPITEGTQNRSSRPELKAETDAETMEKWRILAESS